MNRNTESHFSINPTNLDIQRSSFKRPYNVKTTFNAGDLIPVYVDEVLPGDTCQMDLSTVTRMSTPIFPVMDNAYMDYYFFFVPTRLCWEHWREFNGENRTTFWEQETEYEIPQLTAPKGGWEKGTLIDYFGIPTKTEGISINALPLRAYALIWNEWFRNENLKQPCMINLDDATIEGSNGNNYITDVQKGGKPAKVAKYADYFTSCLPEPQKGPDVLLPLGQSAPVIGSVGSMALSVYDGIGTKLNDSSLYSATSPNRLILMEPEPNTGARANIIDDPAKTTVFADLSAATGATINQLRQAFAIQRLYEKDARGGTRYTEVIKAHFGVTSPDSRLQRPEYLGGTRITINVDQVIQTSATDTTKTPQGNTAAYSLTTMSNHMFTKSFTEHGYIIGLACVRTDHTYQQGIERMWSRKKRFDFYWPTLANISEQGVLNKEIYATGTAKDEEVFGYQEAWAEYRYKPNKVTGAFRSNYQNTLDSWHYADYYTDQPYLSSNWNDETKANINRTIAVQDELEDQFISDMFFDTTWVRPMPVYSIPGLIDHH
ncbi:putative VP1 [Microviridae sp.]|nr:putative VP1 [Microviridae sp.]WNN13345.1 MAG: major capsid protein [Microviridae sp.]